MDYGLLILEILGYNHKDTVKYTFLNNKYLLISVLKCFYLLNIISICEVYFSHVNDGKTEAFK